MNTPTNQSALAQAVESIVDGINTFLSALLLLAVLALGVFLYFHGSELMRKIECAGREDACAMESVIGKDAVRWIESL